MTMVGLERLDDLQNCVETVIRNEVEGDFIEAGTWCGGASILMRATLNSLGAIDRMGAPPSRGSDLGARDVRLRGSRATGVGVLRTIPVSCRIRGCHRKCHHLA
jgi:hypothetical protein